MVPRQWIMERGGKGGRRAHTQTIRDSAQIQKGLFPWRKGVHSCNQTVITIVMLLCIHGVTSSPLIPTLPSIFGYKKRKTCQTKHGYRLIELAIGWSHLYLLEKYC